jgi:hypothetical protein
LSLSQSIHRLKNHKYIQFLLVKLKKQEIKPDIVVCAYNCSVLEAEAEGSHVQGEPGLQWEILCQKKKEITNIYQMQLLRRISEMICGKHLGHTTPLV